MFNRQFLVRFESPKAYRLAVWAGILVALPTLVAGFFLDDYLHLMTVEGEVGIASPWEVFEFAPGKPEVIRELMEKGPYPWFANPELKIKFMRPLTSATMQLDRALFGRYWSGYHFQSILWYAVCLLVVSLLFRKTLPLGLGALALLFYALDAGHVVPVGWWSNRNALVATVPALAGLLCHIKYREEGWVPGLPLSILGYALGLAGGETALGIFGYLFAYELLAARGTVVLRFFMLVPAGILGLAYVLVYKALGYGTSGSGIYIDPTRETLDYLINAPSRLLLNTAGHLVLLPAELPIVMPKLYWPLTFVALLVVLALGYMFRQAWHKLDAEEKRQVRWYVFGAFLAFLPVLATFPSIRLLMMPSLGLVVVLAVIVRHVLREGMESVPGWQWHTVRLLLVLHLVVSPLIWLGFSLGLRTLDTIIQHLFLTAEYDHHAVAEHRMVVLHSENPMFGVYPRIAHAYHGFPEAKSWWAISVAPFEHILTRTADNAFEMEIVDGELLTTDMERLLRGANPPFRVGEQVELDGMTVTVLELGKSAPRRFRVETEKSLDDPEYIFLAWKDRKVKRMEMPEIGRKLVLTKQGLL